MKLTGIDCSHHQGQIDWSEVVKNDPKISFAFLKATEGTTYVDPALKLNATEAKKYGVPIGYYHFATLNSTTNVAADAKAEAIFFVSVIGKCPPADLPLILDIESNKAGLTKDQVLQWINAFFAQMVQLVPNEVMLYSYTPFLNENLPANHNLGRVRLWLAAYNPMPKIPIGWNEYTIWQYSAKGKVKGIKTDCDMNITEKPIVAPNQ